MPTKLRYKVLVHGHAVEVLQERLGLLPRPTIDPDGKARVHVECFPTAERVLDQDRMTRVLQSICRLGIADARIAFHIAIRALGAENMSCRMHGAQT